MRISYWTLQSLASEGDEKALQAMAEWNLMEDFKNENSKPAAWWDNNKETITVALIWDN